MGAQSQRHGENAIEKNQHDLTFSIRAGGRDGRASAGETGSRTASRHRERRASSFGPKADVPGWTASGGGSAALTQFPANPGRVRIENAAMQILECASDLFDAEADPCPDRPAGRSYRRGEDCPLREANPWSAIVFGTFGSSVRAWPEAWVVTRARSNVGRGTTRGKIEFEGSRNRDRRRRCEDDAEPGTFGKGHDAGARCHEGNAASDAGENTAKAVMAAVLAGGVLRLRAIRLHADRGIRDPEGGRGGCQKTLKQQCECRDQADRGTPCNRALAKDTHPLLIAKRAANAMARP